jgi:hypothetical protein
LRLAHQNNLKFIIIIIFNKIFFDRTRFTLRSQTHSLLSILNSIICLPLRTKINKSNSIVIVIIDIIIYLQFKKKNQIVNWRIKNVFVWTMWIFALLGYYSKGKKIQMIYPSIFQSCQSRLDAFTVRLACYYILWHLMLKGMAKFFSLKKRENSNIIYMVKK